MKITLILQHFSFTCFTFKAVQIYSTLGMTNIDDLVNNIFSVFDRLDVGTIEG